MEITTIILVFPNIRKEFAYTYPYELNRDREEEAMRDFYENEAPTLFALYGYAPMDVHILHNDTEIGRYRACYQETLWDIFFKCGGEPWHGRFGHFTLSLIERRYSEERRAIKQAA